MKIRPDPGGRGIALAAAAVLGAGVLAAPARAQCGAAFTFANFNSTSGLTLVGSAGTVDPGTGQRRLRLTPSSQQARGAAWRTLTKANLLVGFDTTFSFRLDGVANGFAFVVQDQGPTALGAAGSAIGYAGDAGTQGIARSIAIEFDTFSVGSPDEFGADHISIQTQGTAPNSSNDAASLDNANLLSTNINNGAVFTARVRYAPGLLEVFLTNLDVPLLAVPVTLTALAGGSILDASGCAWVGFTAANGSSVADQEIVSWTFDDYSGPCVAPSMTTVSAITPVNVPSDIVLSVALSGSGPRTMQWRRNGVLLADSSRVHGATTATLRVGPTTTADTARYEVTLSNPCGTEVKSFDVRATCLGDADASNTVDFTDISVVLSNWLANYMPLPLTGPGDADNNGVVNFLDIIAVLSRWEQVCQ